ncbi:hypothetical protein N7452_007638 [Penicillium brevicompactum]|uniref:Uncharacterized protein n=1 Tax=Penicillium brevicompactum TaxID=5074 RepID=A0A9W9QL94_PENBR|nr:hypothetical protein N7452_007638 [Penicillium brevicompactum]
MAPTRGRHPSILPRKMSGSAKIGKVPNLPVKNLTSDLCYHGEAVPLEDTSAIPSFPAAEHPWIG